MANSPIVAQDGTGGSTTIVVGSALPVSAGFGWIFGSEAGLVPRDIILDGGLRGYAMNGKTQSPILYTEPSITKLAVATIDGNATTPTLIEIMGGMKEVEFTHVSFRRFVTGTAGALSPANLSGSVYSAEPVNGVWSDAAALIPATNLGGFGGRNGKRVECAHQLGRPTGLWYRPVARAACIFEIAVWGMPEWALNHIKTKV